jgi:hypothetical protein
MFPQTHQHITLKVNNNCHAFSYTKDNLPTIIWGLLKLTTFQLSNEKNGWKLFIHWKAAIQELFKSPCNIYTEQWQIKEYF